MSFLPTSMRSKPTKRISLFLAAFREVEKRMKERQDWERLPKPTTTEAMPEDPDSPAQYMEKTELMYRMARLAFETDSTRSITLLLDSNNSPTIRVPGADISDGYHNLSHHGKNEKKLSQLDAIDRQHMRLVGDLINDLQNSTDGNQSNLLENTIVMYGSNFGDASKHTTDNMPVIVAGGRLKHGQHLAFDRDKNYPLPNLFVSMLQSMDIELEQFATSTGTMTGLDVA